MAQPKNRLLDDYRRKLLKAIGHLEYSYDKVTKLPANPGQMDDETLETWESFTARFARVVDLFLAKYLKAYVLKDDPGFQGTLRDFVDYGEKIGLVKSADRWMEYRGFRNLISHEYDEDELQQNFSDMRALTPEVLAIRSKI